MFVAGLVGGIVGALIVVGVTAVVIWVAVLPALLPLLRTGSWIAEAVRRLSGDAAEASVQLKRELFTISERLRHIENHLSNHLPDRTGRRFDPYDPTG